MCSRPAPPPSRYGYSLEIDFDSLPKGITMQKHGDFGNIRWFIINSGDKALIINERFHLDGELEYGEKLVSGNFHQYFR